MKARLSALNWSSPLVWAGLFTVSSVGIKGAYVLFVIYLASRLPPAEYAEFGLVYGLQSGVTMLALTGLVETAVGNLRRFQSPRERHVLFTRTSGLFVLTSTAAITLVTPIIAMTLTGRDLVATAGFGIAFGLVSAYAALQANFLRIEHRNALSLLAGAAVPLSGILGMAGASVAGWGTGWIFAAGTIGSAATLLVVGFRGGVWTAPPPDLRRLDRGARQLAPFVMIALLGWFSGYGMNFVIERQFSALDVAAFTLLFTVASMGQLIANSANMVVGPRFYSAFNTGELEQAERESRAAYALLAAALGLIGFIAVGLFPWVAAHASANLANYAGRRLELALLLCGYVLCIPWWQGQNYYFVNALGPQLMRLSILSGVAGLAVWVAAMAALGPLGIFVGFALQMFVRATWMTLSAKRVWGTTAPAAAIAAGVLLTLLGLAVPGPVTGGQVEIPRRDAIR